VIAGDITLTHATTNIIFSASLFNSAPNVTGSTVHSCAQRSTGAGAVNRTRVAPSGWCALAKQQLVRREDDPVDGRRQLIFPTAAGRAHAHGARGPHARSG
jgi:hypothetical protein